ncbi:hypothetical protein SISNIDRAFT_494370 [Sistotremastrum niveocremeum HHB9708]|uniref:F-box domain-containing protein n=2 Tax=Sistotremastraceae TaxID=3402574 RepID=A0A164WXL8_9AGAM|nr:hypothetical protein SISNIDRAFT_494370 [Sistotremastrum niveocremeum HHB9708]KZT39763.1 hypothetical protein SISSUDRAFT_1127747 [Sistotremastrum suecicum HHB10207 ss-3]
MEKASLPIELYRKIISCVRETKLGLAVSEVKAQIRTENQVLLQISLTCWMLHSVAQETLWSDLVLSLHTNSALGETHSLINRIVGLSRHAPHLRYLYIDHFWTIYRSLPPIFTSALSDNLRAAQSLTHLEVYFESISLSSDKVPRSVLEATFPRLTILSMRFGNSPLSLRVLHTFLQRHSHVKDLSLHWTNEFQLTSFLKFVDTAGTIDMSNLEVLHCDKQFLYAPGSAQLVRPGPTQLYPTPPIFQVLGVRGPFSKLKRIEAPSTLGEGLNFIFFVIRSLHVAFPNLEEIAGFRLYPMFADMMEDGPTNMKPGYHLPNLKYILFIEEPLALTGAERESIIKSMPSIIKFFPSLRTVEARVSSQYGDTRLFWHFEDGGFEFSEVWAEQ